MRVPHRSRTLRCVGLVTIRLCRDHRRIPTLISIWAGPVRVNFQGRALEIKRLPVESFSESREPTLVVWGTGPPLVWGTRLRLIYVQ